MHGMYSMRQIKAQDYATGNTLISMQILVISMLLFRRCCRVHCMSRLLACYQAHWADYTTCIRCCTAALGHCIIIHDTCTCIHHRSMHTLCCYLRVDLSDLGSVLDPCCVLLLLGYSCETLHMWMHAPFTCKRSSGIPQ